MTRQTSFFCAAFLAVSFTAFSAGCGKSESSRPAPTAAQQQAQGQAAAQAAAAGQAAAAKGSK